jgi:hypothetical protein
MVKRFNKAADLVDAQQRLLICRTPDPLHLNVLAITHLQDALDVLLSRA